jgi:hypothetical protein
MSTLMLSSGLTTHSPAIGRRVARLTTVAAAVASALAIWLIAELALTIDRPRTGKHARRVASHGAQTRVSGLNTAQANQK